MFVDEMCPEKGITSLSRPTITRMIDDLSQDIENALK